MKNKGENTLEVITLTDNQQPNKYYSFVSDSKNEIENSLPDGDKSYIESVGSVNKLIKELEKKMFRAAAELDFENAALLRDKISELRANLYTLITGLELSLLQHKMKTVGE